MSATNVELAPIIDSDFQRQMPQASAKSTAELESDIVANGIRDSLVVWAETNILLDGHRRFEIAQRRGIVCAVNRLSFPDREAASAWIDRNAIVRRNLTEAQTLVVYQRMYQREKRKTGRHKKNGAENRPHSQREPRTRDKIARAVGKASSTVGAALKLQSAIESLEPVAPKLRAELESLPKIPAPMKKKILQAAAIVNTDAAAARLIIYPDPAQKTKRGSSRLFGTLPSKPLTLLAQRAASGVASAVSALSTVDFSRISGSPIAAQCCASLRAARTQLSRTIHVLEKGEFQ